MPLISFIKNINKKMIPLFITIILFIILFTVGSILYRGFFSLQNFLYLIINNAYLGVIAIGMTFVILSKGIDLSVGSVVALTTMVSAYLIESQGWNPFIVLPLVLLMGAAFGLGQGALIHFFKIQPFIITLAGMFLARGLCYVISINRIPITNTFISKVSDFMIMLPGGGFIKINVLIFIAVIIFAVFLAHYTKFGRTVYAMGGNEQSAILMGLPVGKTKILIYTMSGLLSALAGVIYVIDTKVGYGLHTQGTELFAIACVVIGGTLLTGGFGYVIGTVFGVLILGVFYVLPSFDGNLNSWWTSIFIGILLFIFILLHSVFNFSNSQEDD